MGIRRRLFCELLNAKFFAVRRSQHEVHENLVRSEIVIFKIVIWNKVTRQFYLYLFIVILGLVLVIIIVMKVMPTSMK